MNPAEFKERFRAAMPDIPVDLDLELGVFGEYLEDSVESLDIDAADRRILREVGFPEDSAPFLSFTHDPGRALRPLTEVDSSLGDDFRHYRLFGSNGSGDSICIDQRDGNVVYLNHDWDMKRILINSSVSKFAEAICLLAEAKHKNPNMDFLAELAKIDAAAVLEDAMWPSEHGLNTK
jgi:hypothetical protein